MNHMSKISHPVLRGWWNSRSRITCEDFILPLFISENEDAFETIPSMPGVNRMGVNKLEEFLSPLLKLGLKSVLVFGVLNSDENKDNIGTPADDENGPVILATKYLKAKYPDLLVCCDVCLCEYTSHGHCGVLYQDGNIDISASLKRISTVACAYVKAGADVVAPSDMMPHRIREIKESLRTLGADCRTCVMSYSSKFSSSMYGPFRDACKSGPKSGDRKTYQLPVGSSQLGLLTTRRDIEEGADIVMVKPGMWYLDVVSSIKASHPDQLVAVYQVSGEYAMIHDYATKSGNFKQVVCEALFSMKRSGADIIISYYTPILLEWLSQSGGVLTP